MSRIIAAAAIRGAHKIVNRADGKLAEALAAYGPEKTVEFPNTGYYLPIIYGMTGVAVETLGDMTKVMERTRGLLPPLVTDQVWLPYLGHTLDAGMATLFAEEIEEALKYLQDPIPYLANEPNPMNGQLWLGAANDVILRERGIQFVDGTAPGFAAIVGAVPDNETAVRIARELQQRNLYVFMCSDSGGRRFAEQLREADVQMGWETRLVPFGTDLSAAVFALGFATRAAMSFGGIAPGDYRRILLYNKDRVFAFVLALGPVDDEKYANAAGAINWGFPCIADTDIPEILPTGVCTYEHVVSKVPHDQIVNRAVEVRGLKVAVSEVPVPVPFGPAFEGEVVRREDMQLEFGGKYSTAFEFLRTRELDEIEDHKIEVIGPDVDTVPVGGSLPLGILCEVAGRQMQPDFEPILERRIHTFINEANSIWHMGQRDLIWARIGKDAYKAGFRLNHFGEILWAQLHHEFGAIVDKVQVTIYTEQEQVEKLLPVAQQAYQERDERVAGMTDESVEIFYSCSLCQSFAPNHVCIITPERLGLCGAYNWLDGKASYQINPTGPNQPVEKGRCLDPLKGQWEGINAFVYEKSHKHLEKFNAYSMMEEPMTSCGCFECIIALIPEANGVMVVNREHPGMTPCGMRFTTLAGSVGGGLQTPGFVGVGRLYLTSKKFILAEGGLPRIVWMPKALKDAMRDRLQKRCQEIGMEDLLDKIADETNAESVDDLLPYLEQVGHPALTMDPMF
ncbi:MAG: CO dehydrogenase/CO-methylating acetyl-CoA synthase complex subunit beta [Armatimonadetes bacterium]|nr:CO dehydrogenase/CO-methylating acetyl-CoA synthase complex subunit beta [Armatimonadota bacterium]